MWVDPESSDQMDRLRVDSNSTIYVATGTPKTSTDGMALLDYKARPNGKTRWCLLRRLSDDSSALKKNRIVNGMDEWMGGEEQG